MSESCFVNFFCMCNVKKEYTADVYETIRTEADEWNVEVKHEDGYPYSVEYSRPYMENLCAKGDSRWVELRDRAIDKKVKDSI